MFKQTQGLIISPLLILGIVFLSGCRSVYHFAQIENKSQQVEQGNIDEPMDAMIDPYRNQLMTSMEEVIGQCSKTMTKERPESALGNWFGDAIEAMSHSVSSRPVDFAVQNFGGIRRSNLVSGPIKVGTVYELMPFDNYLVIVTLDSSEVVQFANHMAQSDGWPVSKGLNYDIRNGQAERILVHGNKLSGDRTYRVAMPDYIANGGDHADFLIDNPQEQTGLLIRDGLIQYIRAETAAGHTIDAEKDGRIKILNP